MDREQALDVALGQIERQFGKGAVMKMNDAAQTSIAAVSTAPSSQLKNRLTIISVNRRPSSGPVSSDNPVRCINAPKPMMTNISASTIARMA